MFSNNILKTSVWHYILTEPNGLVLKLCVYAGSLYPLGDEGTLLWKSSIVLLGGIHLKRSWLEDFPSIWIILITVWILLDNIFKRKPI